MSPPSTHISNTSIFGDFINMSWNPTEPFNELPSFPSVEELETSRVLKQCIRSRTALAELNQSAEFLPNKELLINIMPLLEARASSEIENIVTTSDALFRSAVMEKSPDPATKEALSYRQSLYAGYLSIQDRPITTATAEEICSTIKQQEMHVRKVPGTTLKNGHSGETIYTPPAGEHIIRDHLTTWENFIHQQSELDPLVIMAAAHYQFEAIHPFTDGNGRTGRVINILLLVSQGLLKSPILYLSRGIIRRRSEYYQKLIQVTKDQAWEEWILYMLEVIEESARWTFQKIHDIRVLHEKTKEEIKEKHSNIYSSELVDVLFNQPYCRIHDLVEAGIAKRQAASTYLKQLVSTGMLSEEKVGREKIFIHHRFLALLLDESDSLSGNDNHHVS